MASKPKVVDGWLGFDALHARGDDNTVWENAGDLGRKREGKGGEEEKEM